MLELYRDIFQSVAPSIPKKTFGNVYKNSVE